MHIKKYFEKSRIIINLAKYEIYYQVASARLIDITKTDSFNYEIQIELALGSIYEMINEISSLDNIEEVFDLELQKQCSMDALQNFVNQNLDSIKNGSIDIECLVNEINDNIFFNEIMLDISIQNEKEQIKKWKNIINDELANSIMTSLLDLQNK